MGRQIRLSVNGKEFDRSVKIEDLIKLLQGGKLDPSLIRAKYADELEWYPASDFVQVWNQRSNNKKQTDPVDLLNEKTIVINRSNTLEPPPVVNSFFEKKTGNEKKKKSKARNKLKDITIILSVICLIIGIVSAVAITVIPNHKKEDAKVLVDTRFRQFENAKSAQDVSLMLSLSKQLADKYQHSGIASRALSDAYLASDDFTNCITEINRGLEINPKDARGWKKKAIAYSEYGYTDDAIAYYKKAINLSTNDPSIYADYSQLLIQNKNIDLAISYLDKAMIDAQKTDYYDPEVDTSKLRDLIARNLTTCKEYDKALKWCDLLLNDPKDNSTLYYRKALIYYIKENYAEMNNQLSLYVKYNNSKTDQSLTLSAAALRKQKKYTDALNVYHKALEYNPNSIVAMKGIASCLYIMNKDIENLPQIDFFISKISSMDSRIADDFANELFGAKPTSSNKKFDSVEKTVTDSSEIQNIEILRKAANRYEANLIRYSLRYKMELDAFGIDKLISPDRIFKDPDLSQSFIIIEKMRSSFERYKANTDAENHKAIAAIQDLKIPNEYKQTYIAGIRRDCMDPTCNKVKAMTCEGQILDQELYLFQVLKQYIGKWTVKNGQILFSDDIALAKYNQHIEEIASIFKSQKSYSTTNN